MFSNAMVAFLAAIGSGAWVYSKMFRQTGGNTTNALVVAGGIGLVVFLAVILILGVVFSS